MYQAKEERKSEERKSEERNLFRRNSRTNVKTI